MTDLRVLVLWARRADYVVGCLDALARRKGRSVLGVFAGVDELAPYRPDAAIRDARIEIVDPVPDVQVIRRLVSAFQPDVTVACGWHIPAYRKVMSELRGGSVRLLYFDTQWLNTRRQRVLRHVAQEVVPRISDGMFLPGTAQEHFSAKAGLSDMPIFRGALVGDTALFHDRQETRDPAFIFAGRLVEAKGVDRLAEAYRAYRSKADDRCVWGLRVAGVGPLARAFDGIDGVEMLGFLQPDELALAFNRSQVFVLPSRFEPWGVAVHEAMSCGLPALLSSAVGAGADLLTNGGGWQLAEADVTSLAEKLREISSLEHDELVVTRKEALAAAAGISHEAWCDTIERAHAELAGKVS